MYRFMNSKYMKNISLTHLFIPLAFLIFITVLYIPIDGLNSHGHIMLSILCLAIVLWTTESMAYPISALLIIALSTLLIGLIPQSDTQTAIGTRQALVLALKGFSSPSMMVISGALIMATAMQKTELDQRIAQSILFHMKSSKDLILIGCLTVGILFAFLIPSPTGRTAIQIPILISIASQLNSNPNSKLATFLVIGATHISTIWNVGIMTAATHNIVGLEFMDNHTGFHISWLQWFIYASPWSLVMTIILFFILKIELKGYPINFITLNNKPKKIPWTLNQKKLLIFNLMLITLWVTEGVLHQIDVPTSMSMLSAILLFPKIGVFSCWKDVEKALPWGLLVMFGASLSLGMQLANTGAATWIARSCFQYLNLASLSLVVLVLMMTLFTIVLHLGFASATSLTVILIPIFLALTDTLPDKLASNASSLVLLQLFAVSLGMILPVNAPQNMLSYSTGLFDAKTFIRIGFMLTIAALGCFALFSITWWQWLDFIH